jgi:DNA-binding NarL/FixJ family response regulator
VVLVAAGSAAERAELAATLPDYTRIAVASAHEAELVLAGGGVAVVVVATDLADMAGLEWLGQLRRRNQTVMRLFAPTKSSEELAIAAINLAGVFRYVRQATEQGNLAQAVSEAKTIKAHAQCRTSTTGCLVQEQQDRAPLPESLLRRVSSQVGWTGMGIMSLSIFLFGALVMGIGVFSILYMIKTSLGIDLIPDWHLHDWLAQ